VSTPHHVSLESVLSRLAGCLRSDQANRPFMRSIPAMILLGVLSLASTSNKDSRHVFCGNLLCGLSAEVSTISLRQRDGGHCF
jgi:hypothetical protein